MDEIKQRIAEITENDEIILYATGGTYASWAFRKCLQLAKDIEPFHNHPGFENLAKQIVRLTGLWKRALRRHNSQVLKCTEYDLETGLPINPKAPLKPVVLKLKND